jgi:tetratricopeptide (TPR) repeat protein
MPEDREIALQFSRFLYAGNAFQMVESVAGNWTRNHPNDEDFLTLLSLAQARQGKKEIAVESARHVVNANPDNVNAWLNMVQISYLTGDTPGAENALEQAEEIDPGSVNAAIIRVELLVKQGQLEEAVKHLEDLVSKHRERMDLKVRLAQLYGGVGRKADALNIYREVSRHEPSASIFYVIGLLLYDAGEVDEALVAWEQCVKEDPYFTESRLATANHYSSNGELQRALDLVTEALEMAPKDPQALALRGKIYFAEEKWHDAVRDLSGALDLKPDLLEARLLLGRAQLKTGEITNAKVNIGIFLEKRPENPLANLLLAKIESRQGELEASSKHAALASRDDALGQEAMWTLADNALKEGRYSDGKAIFERNEKLFGSHPTTTLGLARSADLLGEVEAAEKKYRELLREKPDDIISLTHLVLLLSRTDRKGEAFALVREKAAMGGIPQRLLLGRMLESSGDFIKARETYMSIIKDRPDFLDPYQRIVTLYARDSNLEGALKWLDDSLKNSEKPDARLIFLKGIIEESMGKRDAAITSYRDVLNIAPEFVPAMNNLAWNLSETGQLVEALKHSTKARKLAPDDPNLADTHAWILHKSGDSYGALPILRQAIDQLPENKEVALHLIEVLEAVGRTEEAQQLKSALK